MKIEKKRKIIETLEDFEFIKVFFIMLLSVPIAGIVSAIFKWDLFGSKDLMNILEFTAFGIGVMIGFQLPFIILWWNRFKLVNFLSRIWSIDTHNRNYTQSCYAGLKPHEPKRIKNEIDKREM